MSRPTMSEQTRSQFRTELCSAALKLLAERGEAGVTMRAVAGEVGCGVATPYRYFSDKEALFTAVRVRGFHRFADRIEAALAGVADPLDRVRAVGKAYLAFAVDEPQAFRVMWAVPHTERPPVLADAVERGWDLCLAEVSGAVHQGLLHGDPVLIANLLWVGVHGLASLQQAGKLTRGRSANSLADPVVDATLRAFQGGVP
ncbi:MAG: TetR/AcrR family transcriptional regulator [Myxococcota bacterium]